MEVMVRLRATRFASIAMLVSVAWCPTALRAANISQVEANLGLGHSDNINRVADKAESADMAQVGARFQISQDTRRLSADLAGDLNWLKYSDDDIPSELLGNASANVRLGLIEDHLDWVLVDSFGQTRSELFSIPSPENRENVNYFGTGPNVSLGVTAITHILMGARLVLVDYEETPADTQRAGLWVGLRHELPGGAKIAATVSNERVDPTSSALAHFDRAAVYLKYELTGARSSILLEAGGNRVYNANENSSGPLLRIKLARELTAHSTLSLKAGRELTDSGNSLNPESADRMPSASVGTGALVQLAAPFTSTYADVAWTIAGRLTTLSLAGGWYEEDYPGGQLLDRSRLPFSITVTRQVGLRTRFAAGMDYERYDYETSGDNSGLTGRLSAALRLGRSIDAEIAAERFSYTSDSSADVDETRYWLRLRYGNVSWAKKTAVVRPE